MALGGILPALGAEAGHPQALLIAEEGIAQPLQGNSWVDTLGARAHPGPIPHASPREDQSDQRPAAPHGCLSDVSFQLPGVNYLGGRVPNCRRATGINRGVDLQDSVVLVEAAHHSAAGEDETNGCSAFSSHAWSPDKTCIKVIKLSSGRSRLVD